MGAWGVGIFDNDDASDYAGTIVKARDLSGLERTFDGVLRIGTEYLEAPNSSEALAAADIVARLMGRAGENNSSTEIVDAWVGKVKVKPSGPLIDKARRAVSRVLMAPSELVELWQESDEFELWKATVEALSARLA